jgi:hypothetical protein
MVRWRRPLDLGLGQLAPSRYLFISSSLASAAASTIFSRHSSHRSQSSAGISPYSNFMPWDASSQMIAFILIRSTTPLKFSSAPIGIWIGTGLAFRRVFICSTTLKKFAPDAVHLVDERETRHLVLVGLAPDGFGLRLHTADRAIDHARAVEHAHRALDFDREVDVPGVSMMLMRCSGNWTGPCPSRSRSSQRT